MATKKIAWNYVSQRQFPFYSSAAVTGGKVLLGGRDKIFRALDARTGKVLWSFSTKARIDSSPAVAQDRVYFGSNDGRFYVLDINTGKKVWDYEIGAPVVSSPAIANGRIVVGAHDGRLYCFGGE